MKRPPGFKRCALFIGLLVFQAARGNQWKKCADEDEFCRCFGTVRFGVEPFNFPDDNDFWLDATGKMPCAKYRFSNTVEIDVDAGETRVCQCYEDWAKCSEEDEDCFCNANMRIGLEDISAYSDEALRFGLVSCKAENFANAPVTDNAMTCWCHGCGSVMDAKAGTITTLRMGSRCGCAQACKFHRGDTRCESWSYYPLGAPSQFRKNFDTGADMGDHDCVLRPNATGAAVPEFQHGNYVYHAERSLYEWEESTSAIDLCPQECGTDFIPAENVDYYWRCKSKASGGYLTDEFCEEEEAKPTDLTAPGFIECPQQAPCDASRTLVDGSSCHEIADAADYCERCVTYDDADKHQSDGDATSQNCVWLDPGYSGGGSTGAQYLGKQCVARKTSTNTLLRSDYVDFWQCNDFNECATDGGSCECYGLFKVETASNTYETVLFETAITCDQASVNAHSFYPAITVAETGLTCSCAQPPLAYCEDTATDPDTGNPLSSLPWSTREAKCATYAICQANTVDEVCELKRYDPCSVLNGTTEFDCLSLDSSSCQYYNDVCYSVPAKCASITAKKKCNDESTASGCVADCCVFKSKRQSGVWQYRKCVIDETTWDPYYYPS